MPDNNQSIDSTFSALFDPTRLAVIQALSQGSATVSELASSYSMALPSFTQHLGVLERAGLLVSRKKGRLRICSLNPKALKEAEIGWQTIDNSVKNVLTVLKHTRKRERRRNRMAEET